MFAPFFERTRIFVPVSLIMFTTKHESVVEVGIYLFGIRVATYNKHL